MNNKIKPTTNFKEDEEEVFILEDKDYLLIQALRELTHAIRMGVKK